MAAQVAHRQPQNSEDLWAPPESMGERIRILRRLRRISQKTLAQRMTDLGVKTEAPTITRFELYGLQPVPRSRRPQFEHVIAMCIVLGVKPKDLGATVEDYPALQLVHDYPEFATPS